MTKIPHLISLLLLLVLPLFSYSQTTNHHNDSIALVDADWHYETHDGIRASLHTFDNLFEAPQAFYILDIPASEVYRLRLSADSLLTPVAMQAQHLNATAAVNGSFFDMDNDIATPVCYLRIDSIELGINTAPINGDTTKRKYYQYATLCLDSGRIFFVTPDSNRFYERDSLRQPNIMTAGPMLLWHGKPVPQRNDRTFVTNRHNRTAIGQRHDGSVVILVADGRFPKYAAGLTLAQLTLAMQWLGCHTAMNLDGGGSSTLWIDQTEFNNSDGIVNYPSDNKKFDHNGQRRVANIIYIEKATPAE